MGRGSSCIPMAIATKEDSSTISDPDMACLCWPTALGTRETSRSTGAAWPYRRGDAEAAGRLNGTGTMEHSNGDRYEGDWCNGNRDGHGVYTYGNGDSYKGRFARNLRSGPGVFFHHESGMSYNCDWSNNIPTILPAKLRAETSERLEFEAARKEKIAQEPQSSEAQEGDQEAEGSEEKGNEEEAEAPQGPKPLAELLSQDFAAGSEIPRMVIQVCSEDGTAQTGESGRLLEVTFGVFEREEEEEAGKEGEAEAEAADEVQADKGKFKRYPSKAYPLQQEAASNAEKDKEGAEESAAERSRPYPPTFVIGGIKMADGVAVLEGLKLPREVEAGAYRLRIGCVYQNCFQDVEALYLLFNVS
mmetsp:Transcript_24768/g.81296  ORF Transcript_24768/g.81296 Transcript_24768/m.81296 type:complete len:360 (-) Transcript_24768:779-1858(-)